MKRRKRKEGEPVTIKGKADNSQVSGNYDNENGLSEHTQEALGGIDMKEGTTDTEIINREAPKLKTPTEVGVVVDGEDNAKSTEAVVEEYSSEVTEAVEETDSKQVAIDGESFGQNTIQEGNPVTDEESVGENSNDEDSEILNDGGDDSVIGDTEEIDEFLNDEEKEAIPQAETEGKFFDTDGGSDNVLHFELSESSAADKEENVDTDSVSVPPMFTSIYNKAHTVNSSLYNFYHQYSPILKML